ncbi:transcriptional regulator [Anaerobacillus arseniciselenatis]|uniref:Transcriptional regulator n=1 Tax=Anaerobacillus arseniciselenatis TaxID=85682 RepID=A0A1S2LS05_9BACI|nr:helix-turn-helix transcriptional regulator [Anaerobacillus arseniciselenatis]OIJ14437.1 transcriptional regulator [Anaerobacillus arseniciselenatis]
MEETIWGRRIRAFRKLKGFTQEQLAMKLGVSVSVLGEIERGNRVPSEELIEQISIILNVRKEELTSIN